MKATIAVMPGDGIGPEIVPQGVKALKVIAKRFKHDFNLVPVQMGYNALKATGSALTPETIKICDKSNGILLGATGAAQWEHAGENYPPGWGRRQLCRELKHRISVRPARVYSQTINTSPVKPERIQGMDLVVVRDMVLINKEGTKTVETTARGRHAVDRLDFYEDEIVPTLKFGFLLARSRKKKLCLMAQSSVFATSKLWLQVFTEMSKKYPDVEIDTQAPDNCAMQLMRNPTVFDVIVCDSTPMGGMMNNLAALLIGSIGMAPGTTIGLRDGETYTQMVVPNGLYEPIHGSAPVRAGQGIVNPIGTVLAAAMLLRYSLGLEQEAQAVERGVEKALTQGYRTYDIMEQGRTKVGTDEMGDRIAAAIEAGA